MMLKWMVDENGKIKTFQSVLSSGWEMPDLTLMNLIIGYQILPEERQEYGEIHTAYRREFNHG
ncbi:hypothetical protein [Undibacterium sp. WLX3042]|uniref:hypothetical protein n=1 Tax=Undibacterium sp. WLX3042 TaxID=3412686 RepID=UPI003C2CA454